MQRPWTEKWLKYKEVSYHYLAAWERLMARYDKNLQQEVQVLRDRSEEAHKDFIEAYNADHHP